MKLTKRQRKILGFVQGTIVARGFPPTVREIGIRFGIRSPNGVLCHLKALERKGAIIRDASLSRGIRLNREENGFLPLPYGGRIT